MPAPVCRDLLAPCRCVPGGVWGAQACMTLRDSLFLLSSPCPLLTARPPRPPRTGRRASVPFQKEPGTCGLVLAFAVRLPARTDRKPVACVLVPCSLLLSLTTILLPQKSKP